MKERDQQDKTRHGRLDFPMQIYEQHIENNSVRHAMWHWHNSIQLCLIKNGHIIFHIGDKTIEMRTGDVLFINSGILHNTMTLDDRDNYYVCFNIEPELLYSHPGSLINQKYFYSIIENDRVDYCLLSEQSPQYPRILKYLTNITQLYQSCDYLKIYIQLLSIWSLLYDNYFIHGNHYDNERIKQIIHYIEVHYSEKIALQDIADHVGLSKNYLCRDFKNNLHCTVLDYLTNYRIFKSMELLSKDLTITEIGYLCGFHSSSFFIKCFKEKTGVSPHQYRKTD